MRMNNDPSNYLAQMTLKVKGRKKKKNLLFFLFQFLRNPQKNVNNNVIMAPIGWKSDQNIIEKRTFEMKFM